jgi:hypothetical protein
MGRERCLFCDGFIFDGDDVTRPAALGLTVHRQCYRRDVGVDVHDNAPAHGAASDADDPSDD